MGRFLSILTFIIILLVLGVWIYVKHASKQWDASLFNKETAVVQIKKNDNSWHLPNEEWKKRLTPEQYHVMREKGTEKAFANKYDKWDQNGTYICAACGQPLFSSEGKYDSGSGWPSFWEPISEHAVIYKNDYHLFQKRIEVLCSRCESHLGHVFNDGPPPSEKRYCMNSTSLQFIPEDHK